MKPVSISDTARAILDLLGRLPNRQIAARVGVSVPYVRSVRSRYSRAGFMLPPSPKAPRYRRRPTGQPREELRELAETLYRWRTEGRHA